VTTPVSAAAPRLATTPEQPSRLPQNSEATTPLSVVHSPSARDKLHSLISQLDKLHSSPGGLTTSLCAQTQAIAKESLHLLTEVVPHEIATRGGAVVAEVQREGSAALHKCGFLNEAEPTQDDDNDNVGKLTIDGAFGTIFSKDDQDLAVPHYSVESLYSDTGFFQAIARSERFMNASIGVILANAIYIGIEADYNKATTLFAADPLFIIADNFFCVFFLAEILIRFLAFRHKVDCCKDGWFRFDMVLVLMMVAETWVLVPMLSVLSETVAIPVEPMRLMRLMRLTRMARLMRSFPEIVTMCKGLCVASRAMLSAVVMCVLLIYIFAIVMHVALEGDVAINSVLSEEMNRNFATIPRCMWTLLLDGTFMMDGAAIVMTELLMAGTPMCILACFTFLVFMLISAFSIMNMLVGVICRVVNAVAESEMNDAAVRLVKESILMDLKQYDKDGNGLITQDELMHVMNDRQSKNILKKLNIDRLFMLELQRMLFPKPDSTVPIKKIVELMLMCRGDLACTVQTLSSGLSYVSTVMHQIEQRMTLQLGSLEALCASMPAQSAHHGAMVHPTAGSNAASSTCDRASDIAYRNQVQIAQQVLMDANRCHGASNILEPKMQWHKQREWTEENGGKPKMRL